LAAFFPKPQFKTISFPLGERSFSNESMIFRINTGFFFMLECSAGAGVMQAKNERDFRLRLL